MSIIRGQDIDEAARWLLAGRLVAFPTETVYGLGANAADEQAIRAVFAAKGRPLDHPVIVHVLDRQACSAWAQPVSAQAEQLMQAFWPGPLTLVLPRHPEVSPLITAGQDTVALRCPAHPVARQLLQRFAHLCGPQAGVIAPSANRFGQVSPTQADHVYEEFSELADIAMYVLEGEAATVGIESTIVDLSQTGQPARILRPGHVTARQIEAVLGTRVRAFEPEGSGDSPRVSGSLKAHYAPRTPLLLFDRQMLEHRLGQLPDADGHIAVVGCGPLPRASKMPARIHYEYLPADEKQYAARLYDTVRRLDRAGFDALWFEQPPQDESWMAVNDRLQRAAAAFD